MDSEELDVAACLEGVRAGDEDSARALVQHLYPLVMKLVRSHRARRESEEDLAQAVFAKIFAKLDQYSGTVPLSHWVSRVTINTCLNQIARERVRPELRYADLSEEEEQVITALATDADAEAPGDAFASRELVEKLLGQLRPDDRLVIQMLHLENRSLEETAQTTGWSVGVLKVRAFRARARMKKHLEYLVKERDL